MADADDESWLYGEDGDDGGGDAGGGELGQQPEVSIGAEVLQIPAPIGPLGTDELPMETEGVEDDEDNEDDDEDSDDDDGIKVTINQEQIEAAKTNYQTMQLKKSSVTEIGFPVHKEKKGKFAVEDFDAIGTINGQPSVEVDMESLEDKPWRKPGADITDYFNYGFTEDTWAAYCNRQRRMRVNESGVGLTGSSMIVSQNKLTGSVITGTIPTLGGLSGGDQGIKSLSSVPPPSIKKDEPSGITVMTHEKRIYPNKVMGGVDFSLPPPGFDVSVPPPVEGAPVPSTAPATMGEFPPSDPFGEFGAGDDPYQGGYEPTASQQWSVPPPAGTWSTQEPPPGGHFSERGVEDRYRRRDGRDDRYRDRDRDRDRDYDRDRGRRRRSRSRSRDRDSRRDRERDRDRDSDRDRKVKKEKRSRSRSKDKERDRSRSPKHKKSKRDKDKKSRDERDSPSRDKDASKENKERESEPRIKEEPQEKPQENES